MARSAGNIAAILTLGAVTLAGGAGTTLSIVAYNRTTYTTNETVFLDTTARYVKEYKGTDYSSLLESARTNIIGFNNGRFPKLSALETKFTKVAETIKSQKENDETITRPLVESLSSEISDIAREDGNHAGYVGLAVLSGFIGAMAGLLTLTHIFDD